MPDGFIPPQLEANIASIDEVGVVKISFSNDMLVPDELLTLNQDGVLIGGSLDDGSFQRFLDKSDAPDSTIAASD